jgi:hypothetical protein
MNLVNRKEMLNSLQENLSIWFHYYHQTYGDSFTAGPVRVLSRRSQRISGQRGALSSSTDLEALPLMAFTGKMTRKN